MKWAFCSAAWMSASMRATSAEPAATGLGCSARLETSSRISVQLLVRYSSITGFCLRETLPIPRWMCQVISSRLASISPRSLPHSGPPGGLPSPR